MSYRLLRNIHLLCGLVSLPFLLMYGVSAVQMAHSGWFRTVSHIVVGTPVMLEKGLDGPAVAARLGLRGDLRGSVPKFRVVTPGVVHEVNYDPLTGAVESKSSHATSIGVLNRLHHSAGLWPKYFPLRLWGAAVGFVSLATVLLALSGLIMWWQRTQERKIGLVLIVANLLFAGVVLGLIRSAGP